MFGSYCKSLFCMDLLETVPDSLNFPTNLNEIRIQ